MKKYHKKVNFYSIKNNSKKPLAELLGSVKDYFYCGDFYYSTIFKENLQLIYVNIRV